MAPTLTNHSLHDVTTVDAGAGALTCLSAGAGRPLLYLHGFRSDVTHSAQIIRQLAGCNRTFFPTMPGFGSSEALPGYKTVDDLAYLYLDWIDATGLDGIVLMGTSMGAWLALEVATKAPHRFDALVLVSPLGVRSGPPDRRVYPDLFSLSQAQVDQLMWSDPARAVVDLQALSDEDLVAHMRDREAVARYGWDPYFHTPNLLHRLGRLRMPTLIVRGEDDGLVGPHVVELLADRVAGARVASIPGAGHFVESEQPALLAAAVERFTSAAAPAAAAESAGGSV